MSSDYLGKYLEENMVEARFFRFEGHTMTVDAAANRLGISRERIIKSILFVDDSGLPVLGIVTGDKRVSEVKVARVCGARYVRKAEAAEVKRFTGYDVGAVPPVGHKVKVRTFIDEKVTRFEKVVGGGGEINVLPRDKSNRHKKVDECCGYRHNRVKALCF